MLEAFCKSVSNYKLKYREVKAIAGLYTSYFHADFGKITGNLPDGREAFAPLSPSLGATSGNDRSGMLTLFNSVNKLDLTGLGNGMALDVKLLPQFFDKVENRDALKRAIQVYFEQGGLEIQFNVVDKETLLKAQENPESYRNLIVRVSGYSAYFVHLSKELQNEIISRTENY